MSTFIGHYAIKPKRRARSRDSHKEPSINSVCGCKCYPPRSLYQSECQTTVVVEFDCYCKKEDAHYTDTHPKKCVKKTKTKNNISHGVIYIEYIEYMYYCCCSRTSRPGVHIYILICRLGRGGGKYARYICIPWYNYFSWRGPS